MDMKAGLDKMINTLVNKITFTKISNWLIWISSLELL